MSTTKNAKKSTTKLEPISTLSTKWLGLWRNSEKEILLSASISLAELRKYKGNVRLIVVKNEHYDNGKNRRPEYLFALRDTSIDKVDVLDIHKCDSYYLSEKQIEAICEQYDLYTREQVECVMRGACEDGLDGYAPDDCEIEDYV